MYELHWHVNLIKMQHNEKWDMYVFFGCVPTIIRAIEMGGAMTQAPAFSVSYLKGTSCGILPSLMTLPCLKDRFGKSKFD